MKARFLFGTILLLVASVSVADVPSVYVLPGVEYRVVSSGCSEGICERFEWERMKSGGEWTLFADGLELEVRDKLQVGEAARYRVRAYVQGWVCDEAGCRWSGPRIYGPYSEASDWVIGYDSRPGTCMKPLMR